MTGRRARIALSAVVALLLVSGAGAIYLRQGARTVTVDAALEAYRAGAPATTAPAATAPSAERVEAPLAEAPATTAPPTPASTGALAAAPPSRAAVTASGAQKPEPVNEGDPAFSTAEGVYVYATDGHEETNALGGARHDYPAETAMTVRRAACGGWTQRWQPLRERWDESDLCPEAGGALSVRRFTTYHEFFQRGQQQEFTCPEGSHVYRHGAAAGAMWNWRCTAGGSAIDTKVTVVGTERLSIGGTAVDAVHVHYESTLSGANRGRQDQHRWIDPTTGLNVKITTDIDTQAHSPFGDVHYVERYTITLTSLTPRT